MPIKLFGEAVKKRQCRRPKAALAAAGERIAVAGLFNAPLGAAGNIALKVGRASAAKQWKKGTETDCNLWVIVLKSKRNFNVRLLRREAAKLLRAYHARCGQNFAFDPRRASEKAYLQGLKRAESIIIKAIESD